MTKTVLKNDLLLRALLRQPIERTPTWIMRQAGRYLPEYRATRARAGDFIKLMSTPELACEVTLQPLVRFPLDAAILFSDILTIPSAMGLGLHFVEGEGPAFEYPLHDVESVKKLSIPDPETDIRYVVDAVRLIRAELAGRVPLIGFAGSPWTLATYMVEGRSSREFARIKTMLYQEPATLHLLLEKLAAAVTLYLNAQIAAGAQTVMLFDTWGGALAAAEYREFSLQYMTRIVSGLTREREDRRVPVILFTKGGGGWLEAMAGSGADALGIDWTQDIGDARRRVGNKVALQGNLDPAVLRAAPEHIREQVGKVLESFGNDSGHVFNLGHGITQDIKPEHLAALVAAVEELSPKYHR
ncbi:MAG TPA: uroporphyrinogen decarboxylase [Gammaproteobacteria bacterium]|nr:uroporphyrinogen decarboxylase [Gammaproteobacteria bacterium]